jgi:UDP-glucose 4-epimerase
MNLANKSVLVTGGAGFIGSHLVDRLIKEKPSNLVVVDNFFLGKESNLSEAKRNYPKLKLYRQDASDHETMKDIIKSNNIQVIFNLAVVPLPASPAKSDNSVRSQQSRQRPISLILYQDLQH